MWRNRLLVASQVTGTSQVTGEAIWLLWRHRLLVTSKITGDAMWLLVTSQLACHSLLVMLCGY